MTRTCARIHGIKIQSLLSIGGVLIATACSSGQPVEPTPSDTPPAQGAAPSASSPAQGAAPSASPPAQGASVPTVAPLALAPSRGLIVKFKSDGPASVSDDAQRAFTQRRSFRSATSDASLSLDQIAIRHKFRQTTALVSWRVGLSTAAAKTAQAARWTKAASRHATTANPALAVDPTNIYRIDLDGNVDAAVTELSRDPHVEYAQPNWVKRAVVYTPNDTYFASSGAWGQDYQDLWGVRSIGTEYAWDVTRGAGAIVAVVDTGVDRTHADLSGNVWTNPADPLNGIDDDHNGLIDDTYGWSFANNTNDTIDRHGHGTHVSGTIAAQDNNALGVVGIAPDAKIMPIKGLGDDGSGDTFGLAQGILYAAEHGADVVNNSWGCNARCPSDPATEDTVKQANSLGTVVVFAAGNSNDDVAYYSPSNSPYVISVGASDPNGARAYFSNFGMLDVAAPGSGKTTGGMALPERGILSLKSAICSPELCPPELIVAGNYVRQAGTSMAAPHVAGLAALLASQHPTWTPEQIRQAIRRSADDLNGNGYDTDLGYGRISARKAVLEPTPLEVLLTSPLVTQNAYSTVIQGRASGTGFQSYTLEFGAGAAPTSWTSITTSTTAKPTVGTIATWNTSTVQNGSYTLRLRALTSDARSYEDRQIVALDRTVLAQPDNGTVIRTPGSATLIGALPPSFTSFTASAVNAVTGAAAGGTFTLTLGGTPPVADGTLATWNTTGVAQGHYRVRVTVNVPGGSIFGEKTVIVDPRVHAGFPYRIPQPSLPYRYSMEEQIKLVDLNGDGQSELVIGYDSTVRVLKGDGTLLAGWPQTVDPFGRGSVTRQSPVVGDVDGDGTLEVVSGNQIIVGTDPFDTPSGDLMVWRANGTPVPGWPKNVGGYLNVPVLANLDADAALEIVVVDNDGLLKAYKGNGSIVPGFPVQISQGGSAPRPLAADLDRDGNTELIISTYPNFGVYSRTGAPLPGWPKQNRAFIAAFGDLDGDGDLEIVANTGDSMIQAMHHDGTNVAGWPKSVAAEMGYTGIDNIGFAAPTLADLDADGKADIVIAGRMPHPTTFGLTLPAVWAWKSNGQILPGWPKISTGATTPTVRETRSAPALADVNNDGQVDIIVGRSAQGFDTPFEFYNKDGSAIAGLARPMTNHFEGNCSPAIGDIDGDGLQEAVYLDDQLQVIAYDLDGSSTSPQPWPMNGHDARHSSTLPPSTTVTLPARIEAERYVRFSELSPGSNQGAAGSPQCNRNDGVDIEATTDNGGACNVGWTQAGEWLEYDVNAPSAGAYNIALRVATGIATARVHVEVDRVNLGSKTLTQSNWQSFYDLPAYQTTLSAGAHRVRIAFETSDVNFNYLSITKNVATLPTRLEAESYVRYSDSDSVNQGAASSPSCGRGDGVDLISTTDNNGRCSVSYSAANEWLEYDIAVPSSGSLAFVARVAASAASSRIRLELNGVSLGSRTLTNAGANTYEDQTFTISAAAGNYTLRVVFETASVNLNYVYAGFVANVPGRLEAESYLRYNELDPSTNQGSSSSPQCNRGDGVDIESTNDGGNGCSIGWVQPGEWLEYKVLRNSPNPSWSIALRAGTGAAGKTIQVLLDGVNQGTFTVPNTGWGNFTNVNVPITIPNQNFVHDLRIVFPVNDVNLNYITLN